MGSVLLVIYLMVIILLVTLILMQRNSGNALSGLGGGNGADNFLSARGKGNLLTRTTAILAALMFILALALDLYYKGQTSKPESITDVAPLTQTAPAVPTVPNASEAAAQPVAEEGVPATQTQEQAPVSEPQAAEETTTPAADIPAQSAEQAPSAEAE